MSACSGNPVRSALWGLLAAALSLATVELARAETFRVGPGKDHDSLQDVARRLAPGDVVELYGAATYPGDVLFTEHGEPGNPIVVRGIRVGGKRPIISGGRNTIEAAGDHYVFEGLELTGGSYRCFFHHAHDITLRDSVVRDCVAHGVLGADDGSGSLLLETTEVFGCGHGVRHHQIYVTTDPETHPGSVFRMQHCYVHDANGGNNVKSRAERNEIYFNWIEGAQYHELELIGPEGKDPALAREDSDVVGNVFRKTNDAYTLRIGGDGTASTGGRYRFVNNTFLLARAHRPVFRLFDEVESVQMHNNVLWRSGGGPLRVTQTENVVWVMKRPIMEGSYNWIPSGSSNVPTGWTKTIEGDDPGFEDEVGFDLRPRDGSPLREAALLPTREPVGFGFPKPLMELPYQPPRRTAKDPILLRSAVLLPDIGAYEGGAPLEPAPQGHVRPRSMALAAAGPSGLGPAHAGAGGGRCGCRVGERMPGAGAWAAPLVFALGWMRRGRRVRALRIRDGRGS